VHPVKSETLPGVVGWSAWDSERFLDQSQPAAAMLAKLALRRLSLRSNNISGKMGYILPMNCSTHQTVEDIMGLIHGVKTEVAKG